jgi:hypothetical protein
MRKLRLSEWKYVPQGMVIIKREFQTLSPKPMLFVSTLSFALRLLIHFPDMP